MGLKGLVVSDKGVAITARIKSDQNGIERVREGFSGLSKRTCTDKIRPKWD